MRIIYIVRSDFNDCMDKYKINNLIFSSSATVYGNSLKSPINEKNILSAINPYGRSKTNN